MLKGGLPANPDTETIFKKAVDRNVAFVSGSSFFCNDSGRNTIGEIEEGVKRLSQVINDELTGK